LLVINNTRFTVIHALVPFACGMAESDILFGKECHAAVGEATSGFGTRPK